MSADARDFNSSLVEALLLRGLDGALSAGALSRLREAGIELGAPLPISVPREQLLNALRIAAEELSPIESPPEAHRILGVRLVKGMASSWRMRAVLAAARVAGIERTLAKLVGRHRTPSNFLELEFLALGPGSYALALNLGADHPELVQGMVEQILSELGERGAEVQIMSRGEAERLELHLARR